MIYFLASAAGACEAPPVEAPPRFDDQDLAQWLREAGKRRRGAVATQAALPGMPGRGRCSVSYALAALGALAFLPYYYASVMLQIYSLPRVIVFIMVDGLPPPI